MTDAAPTPLASPETTLTVEVTGPPGQAAPTTMFGIRAAWPHGGLESFHDDGSLTPLGQQVASQVADELDWWHTTHHRADPELIAVVVKTPPAWARHGTPSAEAVEAAADLDRRPVPTNLRHATERVAQARMAGNVGSARRNVLGQFHRAGDGGLTDDQVADNLGMVPNRVATRRQELGQDGLVEDTGRTRPTRSDTPAKVHRITPLGVEVWNLRTS